MSTENKINGWREALDKKVRSVHLEIARLKRWTEENGKSEATFEAHAKKYFDMLNEIYLEEIPYAKILDTSDLIIKYESDKLKFDHPSIALMGGVFENVRREVTNLTKAVAGIASNLQMPKEMDLRLTALARGSLVLGFEIPSQADGENSGVSLLGENDPLYNAARQAVKTLGVISRKISEGASSDEISKAVIDPKLRDTAISAVHKLSPSPRSRIDRVGIIDNKAERMPFSSLTPIIKRELAKEMRHPIKSHDTAAYKGIVREMDLDARRLELRYINGSDISDIRCVYSKEDENEIEKLLNSELRVEGKVEYLDGKPRLMEIAKFDIIRKAKSKSHPDSEPTTFL